MLKLEEAWKFDQSYRGCASKIQSVSLKRPATVFEQNMDRAFQSLDVVLRMILIARYWQGAVDESAFELFGEPQIADNLEDPERERLVKLAESKMEAHLLEFQKSNRLEMLKSSIETLNANISNVIPNPGKSIYFSMIVLGWSAFEVLTGDLWESAINHDPDHFVQRAIPVKLAFPGPEEAWKLAGANDDKIIQIPIRDWRECGGNFSMRLGTMLRRRYGFDKLEGIIEAYKCLFDKDRIEPILSGQKLKILAALRNVIIHRAGYADKEFIQKAGSDPAFSSLKDRDEVRFDGNVVNELLSTAVSKGIELMKFVDGQMPARSCLDYSI